MKKTPKLKNKAISERNKERNFWAGEGMRDPERDKEEWQPDMFPYLGAHIPPGGGGIKHPTYSLTDSK
jgi:hypothetical protein